MWSTASFVSRLTSIAGRFPVVQNLSFATTLSGSRRDLSFDKSVSNSRGDSPCSREAPVGPTRAAGSSRLPRSPRRRGGLTPEGRIDWALRASSGGRPADVRLCGPLDISMMQTTDLRNLQYRARLRPLNGSPVWRILLKRQVSPDAVIVSKVPGQDAACAVHSGGTGRVEQVQQRGDHGRACLRIVERSTTGSLPTGFMKDTVLRHGRGYRDHEDLLLKVQRATATRRLRQAA